MDAFTPRNVAKFVVTQAIKFKTAQKTEELITDYTSLQEDDFVVGMGGTIVGWWVSDKLKPFSDKMVDKTADFVVAKRNEFKENRKKEDPSDEK